MTEIELVEYYTTYLLQKGVEFNNEGYPRFKKEWFIEYPPSVIAPYNKRNYYQQNKKDISLCFFCNDDILYPRLDRVFKEIKIFKQYHSVCMMDLSISPLMLDEVQKMNLLLNLLYICVVAVNNVKIIPSFRTADFNTIAILKSAIGESTFWIMGAIGTQKIKSNSYYEYLFRSKCLLIMPKVLLIYGKINQTTKNSLNIYGIDETYTYKDFRELSYGKKIEYV